MGKVFVSIGSNINREKNIRAGIDALKKTFGELILSPVYETEAVGFDGDPFYNLVAAFETELNPYQVNDALHQIEEDNGRDRSDPKFSSRTLDIDLLLYDDLIINDDKLQIPRDEIEKYAFVLKPLVDIAENVIYPITGKNLEELWLDSDLNKQKLIQLNPV
ncbi:MAG: 2-amino-4-hydroxy-6-hydroxymethyldihydropteridine diphosphokinase [Gammaproteobacteria bacterium]|nr:2-amino-4-hydroxy-6-hydroxymethyldihydropteridine diphosphokinase [Gammaproteobacteria bacterium]